MESLEVSTDLHCQGCVNKITPLLNKDDSVKNWEVDFSGGEGVLKLQGTDLSVAHVSNMLSQVGYSVKGTSQGGFWLDGHKWNRATFNTLNCLLGCSIGDFGMVFYLQAFYPATPMIWQMTLAVIAGLCTSILLETAILKFREHFDWLLALKTAFGMSFISMVAMEIAMTSTDFMITGGKAAFSDPVYWLALLPALIVGFLVPLPYNYYRLKKFNQACH